MRKYPKTPVAPVSDFPAESCVLRHLLHVSAKKLLASDVVHAAFVGFATRAYSERNIATGRYVIMLDHLHLFVRGPDDFELWPVDGDAETIRGKAGQGFRIAVANLAAWLFRSHSTQR